MSCDQCMYGLLTPSSKTGQPVLAEKPTRWATTSPQMAARRSQRCTRDHAHEPRLGGRAADAAFYPPDLVTNILRGMRGTADAESVPEDTFDPKIQPAMATAALFHDVPAGIRATIDADDISHKKRFTGCRMSDGSSHKVPLHKHVREQYRNESTGEPLPRARVEEAIHEELG